MSARVVHRPHRLQASLLGLLFVLAWVAGCNAPETAPESRPPEPPARNRTPATAVATDVTRIAFLGDSLTAGYGVAEDQAFPALVADALKAAGYAVEVVNAGVSGDTSAGGLSRIDWVMRSRPDVLVLELGGNDALRGQPLDRTEQNLRGIVERARAGGARVLLLGMDVPTNLGSDYTRAFSALYRRVADELDVAFVPEFVREVGFDRRLMQLDGLHPTAEGHRRLAASLLPHLEDLLE